MFGVNNWQNKKRPLIEKRTITVKAASPKPTSLPLPQASKPRQSVSPKPPRQPLKKAKPVSRTVQKAKPQKVRPREVAVDFGSEDSDDDDDDIRSSPPKRARREASVDSGITRQIRDPTAFQTEGEQTFSMVHGADLPALDKATKYEPYFTGLPEGFEVQFQYPSRSPKEK